MFLWHLPNLDNKLQPHTPKNPAQLHWLSHNPRVWCRRCMPESWMWCCFVHCSSSLCCHDTVMEAVASCAAPPPSPTCSAPGRATWAPGNLLLHHQRFRHLIHLVLACFSCVLRWTSKSSIFTDSLQDLFLLIPYCSLVLFLFQWTEGISHSSNQMQSLKTKQCEGHAVYLSVTSSNHCFNPFFYSL